MTLCFVKAKLAFMNLKTWLDAERGRATALAAHLGVSMSRISQISAGGVPNKYMLAVRDFTGNAVTLEAMVRGRTTTPAPARIAQAATETVAQGVA